MTYRTTDLPTRRTEPVRVPSALTDGRETNRYEHVILGAGCAGLSLCCYLLDLGVEEHILILDRREEFVDDRTWCFWDVEPTPFSHLATKRWSSWELRADGRSVVQTTEHHPYLCVAGADFYEHALSRIAEHPNVTLRLGTDVHGYKESGDETRVFTSGGDYTARYVFDGRGIPPGSPVFRQAREEACWVPQKFLGLRLRAARPVFDPDVCTLMDFDVDQGQGLRFVYVLPFSPTEALVENVYLSEAAVSPDEHRAEIRAYLLDVYGLSPDDYSVDGEERGYIPMTDFRFPRRPGERAYSIGMLGGETRPSTGYTFIRIQRYCRALAEAVVAGAEPDVVHARRYGLLDGVFLRFMLEHPGRCPDVYRRMFAGVPPEPLVRFLTETSTPADELRLILAMPKPPFVRTAAGALLEAVRPGKPPTGR